MPDVAELAAALRARASALRGLGYRVRIDFSDPGEEASLLVDGAGTVSAATSDTPADCALQLSTSDLQRLIAGRLSPMLAFSTGRLRVEGSKGVALKLASLLDAD